MIYELYQKPSYKWVAFDSKTSEQPIHAIEAPSYIIIFAIIIVPHSKLDVGIIFQIESADC